MTKIVGRDNISPYKHKMNNPDLDFQTVYADFQPKILRYLARLVGESEAEDLTQEVFIKVSQVLKGFRGESQLSTWLYRIATNAALDRLRSSSHRQITHECPELEPEIEDRNAWTGETIPFVENQVSRKEMNECIQGFIQRLPEDYRTVLALSEFEGLRDTEIAEVLGVTVATAKIRLHRARESLKEQFIRNCDSYWIEDNEFLPELKLA